LRPLRCPREGTKSNPGTTTTSSNSSCCPEGRRSSPLLLLRRLPIAVAPPSDENNNNRTTTIAGRGKRTEMGVVGGADRKQVQLGGPSTAQFSSVIAVEGGRPSLLSRSIPPCGFEKAPFNVSNPAGTQEREDKTREGGGCLAKPSGANRATAGRQSVLVRLVRLRCPQRGHSVVFVGPSFLPTVPTELQRASTTTWCLRTNRNPVLTEANLFCPPFSEPPHSRSVSLIASGTSVPIGLLDDMSEAALPTHPGTRARVLVVPA
jgi:hypothetical protein